jgi:hypothetical protein
MLLQAAHKAAEAMKRQIAAQYGIPLRPLQALQQQQEAEQQSSAAAAAAAGCADGGTEGGKQQQVHMSSYKSGVAAPVSAAMLAHQARAAAIALLRCVTLTNKSVRLTL